MSMRINYSEEDILGNTTLKSITKIYPVIHADGNKDAHGFCSQQEFVKDMQREIDNY